ncbi:flagellar biosynthesis protein FlhG [Evansella caseinilytica]|uniref:Flagellar biosynthesis protein FlhG n=1 Tax=Evansella caseinilytica TaxID=1503961 RepID=A0A1H3M591_9BACI|nr:flagellar biosynthesis protein FlhG [Evansella caseinilytica]
MKDQADVLRNKMMNYRNTAGEEALKSTKVIAVVSGKGGVGKSNFVVNFGLALQESGKKVVIFDLDIGMANVDILLGMTTKFSIVDMLEKDLLIREIIGVGPNGLSFVSGGSGLTSLFEIDQQKLDFFLGQLASLEKEYDYILFDMPAGLSKNSIHFLLSAHEIFLVTTPEPTSITDAYATLKYIHLQDQDIPISVVVNKTRKKNDGLSTSRNLSLVCQRFLNKDIRLLGSIPDDEAVWRAVLSQQPFILMMPRSKPSLAVYEAAERYLNDGRRPQHERTSNQSFVSRLKRFLAGG